VEVARECSGIRSGISLVISGLLAGHLFLRAWWRRIAIIAVALPVLIFKNGLRIATLSYLAVKVNPEILRSELHRDGGIPFFVLGLLILYPFLLVLVKWEERDADRSKNAGRSNDDNHPRDAGFSISQVPVSEKE
jgi:exosortase/archaeosortase family protein